MEDYIFHTDFAVSDNEESMRIFLEEHMHEVLRENVEVVFDDGALVRIKTAKGDFWWVNAGGNGDFCSHRISFKRDN